MTERRDVWLHEIRSSLKPLAGGLMVLGIALTLLAVANPRWVRPYVDPSLITSLGALVTITLGLVPAPKRSERTIVQPWAWGLAAGVVGMLGVWPVVNRYGASPWVLVAVGSAAVGAVVIVVTQTEEARPMPK